MTKSTENENPCICLHMYASETMLTDTSKLQKNMSVFEAIVRLYINDVLIKKYVTP